VTQLPFVPALLAALEPSGFRRVEHAGSALAPRILTIDPSDHADRIDNQWAIFQSLFLADPTRGEDVALE